jgi:hypothetical protein
MTLVIERIERDFGTISRKSEAASPEVNLEAAWLHPAARVSTHDETSFDEGNGSVE